MISGIGYSLSLLVFLLGYAQSLNVVIAGGTGNIGKVLLPQLSHHDVTVLTRNAFLASTPNRVTEEFGWLGQRFLDKNPHVTLRDWDGGDLLEIVGSDFIGWGDDALKEADIIIHSVGGFTAQRTMAAERLVQEALRLKSQALHITVSPREEEIPLLSPGMLTLKVNQNVRLPGKIKIDNLNRIASTTFLLFNSRQRGSETVKLLSRKTVSTMLVCGLRYSRLTSFARNYARQSTIGVRNKTKS